MFTIRFLKMEEVVAIHEDQISKFGGSYGIRDQGLLDSALNLPQATFAGEYLHQDIFEMAAAYAHSLIKNHPFIDGNKRTGVLVSLLFLAYNNVKLNLTQDQFFELGISIATSQRSVSEIANLYRGLAKSL